jgi:hypothetical protein
VKDGNVIYIKSNGYVFPEGSLMVIKNTNPFDNHQGLSPLVPLFNHLMLDESMTEHNLRFFTKDVLKGILNLDPNAFQNSYEGAVQEVERLHQQIKNMEATGEAGHLLTYGATWQAMSTSNRDMLTPTIIETIIQAVKTVYRVPPHKLMQIDSGNIGSGTGISQEDSMNETLMDQSMRNLNAISFYMEMWTGVGDTKLFYSNLTNTNEEREADLATKNLANGTKTYNEIRVNRGDEPYPYDWADIPWIDKNTLPMDILSEIGVPVLPQASTQPESDAAEFQKDVTEEHVQERIRLLLNQ